MGRCKQWVMGIAFSIFSFTSVAEPFVLDLNQRAQNEVAPETGTDGSKPDVATLMVMIDLSGSMAEHRQKLVKLADIVEEAMQQTHCDFQVAVGNIQYLGFIGTSYLQPWREPRGQAWITRDTPNGPERIHDRISDPNGTVYPQSGGDDYEELHVNASERTYSSIVTSIEENYEAMRDSVVVGTILLTDAVPAFELYTPHAAVDRIRELLGPNTPYLSAAIVSDLYPHMMVQDPREFCAPDFVGGQTNGNQVDTSSWHTQNITAINEFTEAVDGWQWDVCEPEYDQRLYDFVHRVLSAGGCLPIS